MGRFSGSLVFVGLFLFMSSSIVAQTEGGEENDDNTSVYDDRVCFSRNISSFRTIKGEDDVVLLERGVNHWYRVDLIGGRCDYRSLRSAQSVAIQSRPRGGYISSGDTLIFSDVVLGQSPGGFATESRCTITDIAKVDEEAAG